MSVFGTMLARLLSPRAAAPDPARSAEWESALQAHRLPSFVAARLAAAAAGKAPWVATAGTAELGLVRSRGIRPLGIVSGTCVYQYGQSWWRGHMAGWHQALRRLQQEAAALGANAVVDVRMRKVHLAVEESMDFTVVGTAVRLDALPAGKDPVVATVSALEFVRLLEADIVPVGIAIGADHAHLHGDRLTSLSVRGGASGRSALRCYPASRVGGFFARVRRQALNNLRDDALRQGNGVLAHTHFGDIAKFAGDDEHPAGFLVRHIIIGTVVDTTGAADSVPHAIQAVVDMRDDLSPLLRAAPTGHNAYPVREEEGAI